jgi:hypothetical protein
MPFAIMNAQANPPPLLLAEDPHELLHQTVSVPRAGEIKCTGCLPEPLDVHVRAQDGTCLAVEEVPRQSGSRQRLVGRVLGGFLFRELTHRGGRIGSQRIPLEGGLGPSGIGYVEVL